MSIPKSRETASSMLCCAFWFVVACIFATVFGWAYGRLPVTNTLTSQTSERFWDWRVDSHVLPIDTRGGELAYYGARIHHPFGCVVTNASIWTNSCDIDYAILNANPFASNAEVIRTNALFDSEIFIQQFSVSAGL